METKKKNGQIKPQDKWWKQHSADKNTQRNTQSHREMKREKRKKKRIRIKTGTIKEEYSQANKQTYKWKLILKTRLAKYKTKNMEKCKITKEYCKNRKK